MGTDLSPDAMNKASMNEIMASKRLKEAASHQAEAGKVQQVKAAEADAESRYLSGVGVARQRKAIVAGLQASVSEFSQEVEGATPKDVMDILLLTQYFDTLNSVGATNMILEHDPSTVGNLQRQVGNLHIKQMGALCQAVSFGEIPMMLNGPWFEDRLHVRGRAEMPLMSPEMQAAAMQGQNPYGPGPGGMGMPDPSQMTILIQEEEWNLVKSKEKDGMYEGTYALKQRPHLPPNVKKTAEHAPVNMTFDCQVFIGEGDFVLPEDEEKNPNDPQNGNDDEKLNGNLNKDEEECAQEEEEQDPIDPVVTEFDDLELD